MSFISDTTQALAAAFSFGLVVNGATSATILYLKGSGRSLLRDSPRLVLGVFLVSAALWAVAGFASALLNSRNLTGCHVAVAFSNGLDQLARVALLQCLLWAVHAGAGSSAATLFPQLFLFVRLVVGAVFVGLTRPQFNPVCIPKTQLLPLGIVVLAADVLMIMVIGFRVYTSVSGKDAQGPQPMVYRRKALQYVVLAVAIWTLASGPMVLGIPSLELLVRTTLPAAALSLLIFTLLAFRQTIFVAKARPSAFPPEAPNTPRVYNANRNFPVARDTNNPPPPAKAGGMPKANRRDSNNFLRFGKSVTLVRADKTAEPHSGFRSAPGGTAVAVGSGYGSASLSDPRPALPYRPQTGSRTPGSERFTVLAPPPKKKGVLPPGGKLSISGPVLQNGGAAALSKIPTIDLATAAKNDRDWRDMLKRSSSLMTRRSAQGPLSSTDEVVRRVNGLGRKDAAVTQSMSIPDLPIAVPAGAPGFDPQAEKTLAVSSAMQNSPGLEEIRRRSPRYPPASVPRQEFHPKTPPEHAMEPVTATPLERPDRPESFNPSPPPAATANSPPQRTVPFSQDSAYHGTGNDISRPASQPEPAAPPTRPSPNSSETANVAAAPPMRPVDGPSSFNGKMASEVLAMGAPVVSGTTTAVGPTDALASLQRPVHVPLTDDGRTTTLSRSGSLPSRLASGRGRPPLPGLPTRGTSKKYSRAAPTANFSQAPPLPQQDPRTVGLSRMDQAKLALVRLGPARVDIGPSRQRPPPPPGESHDNVPPGTTLQRRATIGLPSNPRMRPQTLALLPRDQNAATPGEAIFAPMQGSALRPSKSVVHRPRPIPRKPEPELDGTPSSTSPSAAGQPSQGRLPRPGGGSSAFSPKSVLTFNPGSPSQLPPLPPPPRSAGSSAGRPLPNSTRSMTFDEKMIMFYPAPSLSRFSPASTLTSAATTPTVRSARALSAIPDIPPLPSAFQATFGGGREIDVRNSTKSSARTASILEISELPPKAAGKGPAPNTGSVADTYLYSASLFVGRRSQEYGLPGQPPTSHGSRRRSSPVLPPSHMPSPSDTATSPTSPGRDDNETVTYLGPAHSSAEPATSGGPEPAEILLPTPLRVPVLQKEVSLSYIAPDNQKGVVTIMLDASVNGGQPRSGNPTRVKHESRWHRRVGDECPTFSARKERVVSRKMPPPPPLLLGQPARQPAGTPPPEAELSLDLDLESPQKAVLRIQEQLRKFQQPETVSTNENLRQRLTMLQNLEAEMGLQEDHWREMQHNIGRDSLSTMQTSPRAPSPDSTPSNLEASLPPSALAIETVQGLRSNPSLYWRPRTAEADMELEDNCQYGSPHAAPATAYFPVSKARLGSPTPPDTNESDSEGGIDGLLSKSIRPPLFPTERPHYEPRLWEPASPDTPRHAHTPNSGLWVRRTCLSQEASLATADSDSIVVTETARTSRRRSMTALLSITSGRLWQKPSVVARHSLQGLWMPPWEAAAAAAAPSAPSKNTRPPTLRPLRRNRRVTLLPDIIESPRPLPGQHQALGIFQFPWGERSDNATLSNKPASRVLVAMPGTMASGGPAPHPGLNASLEARSRELEAEEEEEEEEEEYSTSFFDDYEEEDEADQFGSGMDDTDGSGIDDDDDDDDFDEATLWEIASLLKTDQVPFKDSLLPRLRDSDEYIGGGPTGVKDCGYDSDSPSGGEGVEDCEPDVEEPVAALDVDAFPAPPHREDRPQDRLPAFPRVSNTGSAEQHLVQSAVPSPESPALVLWELPASPLGRVSGDGLFAPAARPDRSRRGRLFDYAPRATCRHRRPNASVEPPQRITSARLWAGTAEVSRFPTSWITAGLHPHPPSQPPQTVQRISSPKGSANSNTRQRLTRPTASSSDWDAALQEAVSAGKPRETIVPRRLPPSHVPRRSVHKSVIKIDWEAALREAISTGQPFILSSAMRIEHAMEEVEANPAYAGYDVVKDENAFDSSKRHPVFAGSSTATKIRDFHPAATGYTHDVAVFHPVFFGSQTITGPHVHPAMVSLVNRIPGGGRTSGEATKFPSLLWTSPTPASSNHSDQLWDSSRVAYHGGDRQTPVKVAGHVDSDVVSSRRWRRRAYGGHEQVDYADPSWLGSKLWSYSDSVARKTSASREWHRHQLRDY